ncbi:MAG: TonB-dependent receptor [Woeseiaceae bacterium]|nr:TonB-dependent receptor [Woeseiaceae bacterium]
MKVCSLVNRSRSTACRFGRRLSFAGFACLFSVAALSQPVVSEAPETQVVEEIIVTARKTEEDVQEIPMSVQVLSAEFLDVTDATHFFDLQYSVPGLVVNNLGQNGAGFSLRGIADQGGSNGSVASHLDGVYFGTSMLSLTRMFDLERIEVLKGPQGTLYGRNATGGSLNLITRKPEPEFGAGFEAAYGSFETARSEGHLNLPLGQSALRLAFMASEGDGFIRNSVDDRRFAAKDFYGVRASLVIPLSDRLRADVSAQHSEDDGGVGELWLPRPDFLADPADIRLTTVTLPNPFLRTSTEHVTVNLEYDFGAATLHAITGYARSEVKNVDDCAGIPVLQGCIRRLLPGRHRQWSQELRLSRHDGERLEWQAGLYFYDDVAERHFYQVTPVTDQNPTRDHVRYNSETTYAIFGHAVWRLGGGWRLSGGLRWNGEDHQLSTFGTGTDDSRTPIGRRREWNNESWRIDLDYALSDHTLAYAGISTGFKSGGIALAPRGALDDFDPEHLTAYEAGIKSEWRKQRVRLNAAAFYYDFRDLQVNTWTITDDELIFEIDNAARATINGIDVEGAIRLGDTLALSSGVVWLAERKFVKYRNDRTGDTLSGNDLTRAPEWTATLALDKELPLGTFGTAALRVEYAYRSDYFYTTDNDSQFAQSSFALVNLYLRYQPEKGQWYVFASGCNLDDADYFNQVFLQASPGYPETWEAGFGLRF